MILFEKHFYHSICHMAFVIFLLDHNLTLGIFITIAWHVISGTTKWQHLVIPENAKECRESGGGKVLCNNWNDHWWLKDLGKDGFKQKDDRLKKNKDEIAVLIYGSMSLVSYIGEL